MNAKQRELEQIREQIESLKEKESSILIEMGTTIMKKYDKYKNTFVKISGDPQDVIIYMYVHSISHHYGQVSFKGVTIYENNYNYDLLLQDTVYIVQDEVTPLTILDWNKLLEKIKSKYTIKID